MVSCQVDLSNIRGFKALKQMTKMNFLTLQRPAESLETYRELLSYTKVRLGLGKL